MNTADYCKHNILVIPGALTDRDDIVSVSRNLGSSIYFKHLEHDLLNIEFYTSQPCLIYIQHGCEYLQHHERSITLSAGSAFFSPRGLNVHSNFVKTSDHLQAYLVFFAEEVIERFLARTTVKSAQASTSKPTITSTSTTTSTPAELVVIDDLHTLSAFFSSFQTDIDDPSYLDIKLEELLHIVTWKDTSGDLLARLSDIKRELPNVNLRRLLNEHSVVHLSVSDLACISGRSLSSLNRDFKRLYGTTPQTWLREKKLAYAKTLLDSQGLSVTDAALAVGYENVSSFIRAFKLRYGTTPNQAKPR